MGESLGGLFPKSQVGLSSVVQLGEKPRQRFCLWMLVAVPQLLQVLWLLLVILSLARAGACTSHSCPKVGPCRWGQG